MKKITSLFLLSFLILLISCQTQENSNSINLSFSKNEVKNMVYKSLNSDTNTSQFTESDLQVASIKLQINLTGEYKDSRTVKLDENGIEYSNGTSSSFNFLEQFKAFNHSDIIPVIFNDIPVDSNVTIDVLISSEISLFGRNLEQDFYKGSETIKIKEGLNLVNVKMESVFNSNPVTPDNPDPQNPDPLTNEEIIQGPDGNTYSSLNEAITKNSDVILENGFISLKLLKNYSVSENEALNSLTNILLDLNNFTITINSTLPLVSPAEGKTVVIKNGNIKGIENAISKPVILLSSKNSVCALKNVDISDVIYEGALSSVIYAANDSEIYLENVNISNCIARNSSSAVTTAPVLNKGTVGIVGSKMFAKNSSIENCSGSSVCGLYVHQSQIAYIGGKINMSTLPSGGECLNTSAMYITGYGNDIYGNVRFFGTTIYSNTSEYAANTSDGSLAATAVALVNFGHLNLSSGFENYKEFDFDKLEIVSYGQDWINAKEILSKSGTAPDSTDGSYKTSIICGKTAWTEGTPVGDENAIALTLVSTQNQSTSADGITSYTYNPCYLHIADNIEISGFIVPGFYSSIQVTGALNPAKKLQVYFSNDIITEYTNKTPDGNYPIFGKQELLTRENYQNYFTLIALPSENTPKFSVLTLEDQFIVYPTFN